MNKPVLLGLSILHLSKTVMYEFCYDNVKPKYGENTKLFCIHTESVFVYKMLKQSLKLQIMSRTGHFQKEITMV